MNKYLILCYRIIQGAMFVILVSVLIKEIPEGQNLVEGILAVVLTAIGWYILTETIIVLLSEVTKIRKSLFQIENILVAKMLQMEAEDVKIKNKLLD